MARRKPRPSMPYWFWLNQDGCWFCKNRNNCNQCKANRKYAKECLPKKYKGYRGKPPREDKPDV